LRPRLFPMIPCVLVPPAGELGTSEKPILMGWNVFIIIVCSTLDNLF
jgi:hypothetical protein